MVLTGLRGRLVDLLEHEKKVTKNDRINTIGKKLRDIDIYFSTPKIKL